MFAASEGLLWDSVVNWEWFLNVGKRRKQIE
jgi:hypothetical protein